MKIGLYGDSTQAGLSVWGATVYPNTVTPAVMLQMLIDRQCGHGVHTVTNHAVGGSCLRNALTQSNSFAEGTILQHIAAKGDDIIVANYGINDAYLGSSHTAAAHKADYVTLRNAVTAAGKTFLYETPNPLGTSHDSRLQSFVDAVLTISGITSIPVMHNIRTYYPQWTAHLSDGIHPNGIMYTFIGQVLYGGLVGLV